MCVLLLLFNHKKGNTKEAQEFDSLSPDESKRRLLILIKMMDLNKEEGDRMDAHVMPSSTMISVHLSPASEICKCQ